MERALEIFAVVQLTVIGLSHIFQHRAWAEFFIWLRAKGTSAAFANGFLSLAMGSMIVAFHQVWSGPAVVLTIFGVLNLVKAAQCFLLPALSARMMNRVSVDRSGEFIVAGFVTLAVSAATAYALVRSA